MNDNAFTEEQIEAAARALFDHPDGDGEYTWAEMVAEDPSRADLWREDARRVVDAVLSVSASVHPAGERHDAEGLDPYDDFCPTCDAPNPWHSATCLVPFRQAESEYHAATVTGDREKLIADVDAVRAWAISEDGERWDSGAFDRVLDAARAHALAAPLAPSDVPDGYRIVHCRSCTEPALALEGERALCEPCALKTSANVAVSAASLADVLSPEALEHWEWAEGRRARYGDRDCVCMLCESVPLILRALAAPVEVGGTRIQNALREIDATLENLDPELFGSPEWEAEEVDRMLRSLRDLLDPQPGVTP